MLELLTAALPVLVTLIVGWLSHDRFAPWLNELIAFVVIVAVAVFWAFYVHAITGNVMIDSVILVGYCGVLAAGPLRQLYMFATLSWPSPLRALVAKLPAAFKAAQGTMRTPQPRVAPIVPRASLLSGRQFVQPSGMIGGDHLSQTPPDFTQATTTPMPTVSPPPPPTTMPPTT